jgi:hypothetical protein
LFFYWIFLYLAFFLTVNPPQVREPLQNNYPFVSSLNGPAFYLSSPCLIFFIGHRVGWHFCLLCVHWFNSLLFLPLEHRSSVRPHTDCRTQNSVCCMWKVVLLYLEQSLRHIHCVQPNPV